MRTICNKISTKPQTCPYSANPHLRNAVYKLQKLGGELNVLFYLSPPSHTCIILEFTLIFIFTGKH